MINTITKSNQKSASYICFRYQIGEKPIYRRDKDFVYQVEPLFVSLAQITPEQQGVQLHCAL
jgi:hypothetical protein